jgi:hypothetical protein
MKELYAMLIATYSAIGQEMPDAGMRVIAEDLSGFSPQEVAVALRRCRKELKRIALVDILERIPGGHPSAEEAWSICSPALNDERLTLVVTDAMSRALGAALRLQDDPVAARMAFKVVYVTAVGEERLIEPKPRWRASLGHDPLQRVEAIEKAVKEGKISADYALQLGYVPTPLLLKRITS